ncbi:hypothetical protein PVAND_003811 [Polypedilum vanderplanki]|uniref:Uncharacterized protein n=1 Tax=Polypedilum vanderplanki TaxID=319348 RepID=A0A9J6BV54_POLVA|nr:hypothetical protein PVAND_003811 [Polypedilum vanderplanki]
MSDTEEPEERKVLLEEFHFQRRILFGCTIGLFVGIFLWIIAMSTNRWFIVSGEQPIFVESHRRYFKSSHTGIWRNCRYAIIPQPISSSVVRNFTTLGYGTEELKQMRTKIADEEFFKNFLEVELPELEQVNEITEPLRKHMFVEWLKNDNSKRFNELKAKFHSLYNEDEKAKSVIELDPSKVDVVKNAVGELIDDVQFNNTHIMHIIIPNKLRFALFEGWKDQNYGFVRLLSHYAKSLHIDPTIYYGKLRFIFKPPMPPKNLKKPSNGFIYHKWQRCTYHNLFADEAAIAADPAIDDDIIDLSRVAATFSIITIFIMVLGFIFTVYTFLNPRYMFKRLAGGVHFIAGLSSATVCRVLHASVEHSKEHLSYAFPDKADYFYGYGFFFGCIVATINFISCIMFFWYSRKRKGDKAATEELGMADEAIQIGR